MAVAQAERLYRFEQALHIDIELAVNRTLDNVTWLIVGMNYYYAVAHFIVTITVLVWLYRRHPSQYLVARSVFLLTNVLALVVFYFFPLAPPRLLPGYGFIDTVVVHGTWGSWASGDVAAATNQYAAMPSMHVAWSVFCGVLVWMVAERPWIRALGVAHPVVTLVVIVATGNHFVLDAVGGVIALGLGFTALRAATVIRYRVRPPRPPRQPGPRERESEPTSPVPAPA
ncbi:MAG TPA: phosphatase PAP2 family protein [Natronosporangium sp.]